MECGPAEALINGKPVGDPNSILRAPGQPPLTIRSSATQYIGADSSTYGGESGLIRWLSLSLYSSDSFHFADIVTGLTDFSPGPKTIYKLDYNTHYGYQHYSSYISFEGGGDVFRGYAGFDPTKPYSIVIDRYEPQAGIVEGHLDVYYKLAWIRPDTGLDSAALSSIHVSEAKFEAKIRKRDKSGWLDEQQ
jgi:hypothetical protein